MEHPVWFDEPSFQKSRALLALDREAFSRCIRWLTGFAFLQAPNALRGLTEDDNCRLCAIAPEKADHILRQCPALNQLRWESFGKFHWEVKGLARFLQAERVRSLEDSEEDLSQPNQEEGSADER